MEERERETTALQSIQAETKQNVCTVHCEV
jgi:hypothetical protein